MRNHSITVLNSGVSVWVLQEADTKMGLDTQGIYRRRRMWRIKETGVGVGRRRLPTMMKILLLRKEMVKEGVGRTSLALSWDHFSQADGESWTKVAHFWYPTWNRNGLCGPAPVPHSGQSLVRSSLGSHGFCVNVGQLDARQLSCALCRRFSGRQLRVRHF